MKKFFLPVLLVLAGIITLTYLSTDSTPTRVKQSGALTALEQWAAQRAYPGKFIPDDLYYKAYELQKAKTLSKGNSLELRWTEMGPHNIGGRTLAVAVNPFDPYTIYAGSASGGLWRSYSGGMGVVAWHFLPTGFPVLSVGAIVIDPQDTNTIYIGTGEVYAYQNSTGGLAIRTTRGSYGIGILKTTDNGATWTKSLDWSYNQRRGVQVIKMHPSDRNTLFAGTSEGIYKTTDAGNSWTKIHSVLMTTDIMINKNNPAKITAACGNLESTGRGIYYSSDGGNNWNSASGIPEFGGKILLSGVNYNPDILYASVGKGFEYGAGTSLLKSTDFGMTWTEKGTNDYATYQGWYSHFVVPHPSTPGLLLTGGIDVFKSSNDGVFQQRKSNWAKWYFGEVPIGGPEGPDNYSHADHHAYAIDPTDPNTVYFGNDGGIFRTTDFGETFTGLNGSYQSTQFYKRFSVSQNDSVTAIGGMQDNATAIWNGTTAWTRVLGGDGCCTQIDFMNPGVMYGSSQYLGISKTTNRGETWSYAMPPSGDNPFNGQFFLAPMLPTVIYAGGTKLYKSTDAGASWFPVNGDAVINGDYILSIAVANEDADIVFVTTAPSLHRAGVFRSTDGGVTFTDITGNLPDRYPVDISLDPNDASIVYVAFSGFGTSHLYKSTDGGGSWINIGEGLPDVPTSAVAIDPYNTSHLYCGNDLGVFYSTDTGNTWNELNSGFDGSALVMDLAVSITDKKLIAATHGRGVFRIPLVSSIPTGVTESADNIPAVFTLEQNYPNPFNSQTVINFSIPSAGETEIKIYSLSGEEVKKISCGLLQGGKHRVGIDGLNNFSSGIYFYSVKFRNRVLSGKMVYLK